MCVLVLSVAYRYAGILILKKKRNLQISCFICLQLFFYNETIELVFAAAGALLFCGFIIYDTHLLMHKLSPEEYILAAINLYLDIINLFLHLLRLLEAFNKKQSKAAWFDYSIHKVKYLDSIWMIYKMCSSVFQRLNLCYFFIP